MRVNIGPILVLGSGSFGLRRTVPITSRFYMVIESGLWASMLSGNLGFCA